MRGIYIFSTSDKNYQVSGEAKKVLSQVDAFRKKGIEMDLVDISLHSKIYKLLYRLPFFGVYPKKIKKRLNLDGIDFVYIRKNIFDNSYFKLLRHIKKYNQNIKVFVEIPTYPYFEEWNRFIDKPFIIKEKRTLKKLDNNRYVDYYLSLSEDKIIFNTPVIKFENCITIENYSVKKNIQNDNEIHLVGVALVKKWHGFDRVIEGMKTFYATPHDKKVYFHIVGNGTEIPNLKSLVEKYNLTPYVLFEGEQQGANLDYFYDISHIGVGTLGLYRKNSYVANSLKLREYCAKGIPFIKSGIDYPFENYRYCLDFPNDNSEIDISHIVEFVNGIDYKKAPLEMHKYAEQFNWNSFVESVVKRI